MRFIYLIFLLVFINSCGKYQKVLKSGDHDYKYAKAVEYYENGDFNRALPLFNELRTIMIGTSKIEKVSYYFAYSHYSTGDYLMAAYLFNLYSNNYPRSIHAEECMYMSAYCYYLESPNYSLDATNNYKAIKELQNFINKYPTSDKVEECNLLLDELQLKLSKKAFENAKQYFITENYKSAIIALNNVLIDFPSINNREEIYYLIIKSSYLLAINSISAKVLERLEATLDAYDYFTDNYKESKYLDELSIIYNKTNQKIQQLKN